MKLNWYWDVIFSSDKSNLVTICRAVSTALHHNDLC